MREPSPYFIRPSHFRDEIDTSASQLLDDTKLSLLEYWRIVRLHLGLIVSITVSTLLLAGILIFIMTPIYTATCELLIEPQPPQVLDIKQLLVEPPSGDEYDYYKTQYALLRSRSLAWMVIRSLYLQDNPMFAPKHVRGFPLRQSQLALLTQADALDQDGNVSQSTTADLRQQLHIIDVYLAHLTIQPEFGTRLVKLSFSSLDPTLSAIIANAHADAYIRQGIQLRENASDSAQRFLQDKLAELKQRVEKSEVALNAYRHDKGLVEFTTNDNNELVVKRLEEFNTALTEAQASRIALEAQVNAIDHRNYNSIPEVVNSATVQELTPELERLEADYAGMSSRYTDEYAPLAALKAKLRDTQGLLKTTIARIIDSTKVAYQTALAREHKLQSAVDAEKAHALSLHDASVQEGILAREVETNRELYDSVLKRMKEMGVSAEVRSTNVSLVDRAVPPLNPSSPRKRLILLFATVLGLSAGVGIAFVLDLIDDTFKTPDDAERYLHLPSLALIPDVRQSKGVKLSFIKNVSGTDSDDAEGDSSVKLQPWLTAVEAYRMLRGRILLSRAGQPPGTILVTSAIAGEGKSVTAVNTSITFARRGSRLLLIDADLRRPRCHELLHVPEGPGLSEVLTGQINFEDVIVETALGIHLLRAGAEPPDPSELLGSQSMKELLTRARRSYDRIIIDSAPVIPVIDSVMLSSHVDGVLIIANSSTAKRAVKQAAERLLSAGAKLLGIVLNRASANFNHDYYFGYGGYNYKYSSSRNSHIDQAAKPPLIFN